MSKQMNFYLKGQNKRFCFAQKIMIGTVIFSGCVLSSSVKAEGSSKQKPNILFFLLDDEGWKDTGCYGSDFIDTPQADLLAKQGVRFTQAYASPVSSPTRTSLVTGQNSARHGVWEVIGVVDRPYAKMKSPTLKEDFDPQLKTYASVLRANGYNCALVGKWHAGGQPWEHGFEKVSTNAIHDSDLKKMIQGPDYKNLHAYTARSLQYIRDHKDHPFMLCVSHHMVHAGLEADPTLTKKYIDRLRMSGITDVHPKYAAMVEMADQSLGLVVDELKKQGIYDNTIIVYYSDNGGLLGDMYLNLPTPKATTLSPLRGQKGSLYEGGLRVPLIIKWPGVTTPGEVSSAQVCSYDLYPTFIEMAGAALPSHQKIDGLSLVPLLKNKKKELDRKALYWYFPTSMWARNPQSAIREGDYKLIINYNSGKLELYNLKEDIGETINLVDKRKDKAQQLYNDFNNWRLSIGVENPTPNPNYNPIKEKQLGQQKWWK